MTAAPDLLLVTIPFSHFCEKARWALDRAGLRYREDAHLPLLHVLPVRRAGGARQVPVLRTPEGTVCDSTEILRYADRAGPADRRLYPDEPAARAEVDALEDRFDRSLGPATRRLVYFHLLQDRATALRGISLMGARAPAWELAALRLGFRAVRAIMRRGMRIDAAGAERSRQRIREIFAEVGERLRDGRRYLHGDRFGAADLAFAALAAPVVVPAEYGTPLPDLEELPAPLRDEVLALRATPAGAFALRLYAAERR